MPCTRSLDPADCSIWSALPQKKTTRACRPVFSGFRTRSHFGEALLCREERTRRCSLFSITSRVRLVIREILGSFPRLRRTGGASRGQLRFHVVWSYDEIFRDRLSS